MTTFENWLAQQGPSDTVTLREAWNAAIEAAADYVFEMLQHENMNHCWAELHDAQTQIRALKGTVR